MTFSLPWLSRSTVLETMAPLLALLALLQLGPGRRLGKGLLGPCGRGRCCQVQSTSQRDSLFLPLSHLASPSFCPHPQAWLLFPALRMSILSGGNFTLSRGWAPGSVLIYSCPLGRYPSPAWRECQSNGQWQTPRASSLPTLRSSQLAKAVCKRESPGALGSRAHQCQHRASTNSGFSREGGGGGEGEGERQRETETNRDRQTVKILQKAWCGDSRLKFWYLGGKGGEERKGGNLVYIVSSRPSRTIK